MHAEPLTQSAQEILQDEGYYAGKIDGAKGGETIAAIRRYQIRNGLQITGELDAETQRSLGLGSLRAAVGGERSPPRLLDGTPYESAAADVRRHVIAGAQTMLIRRGYYRAKPDGAFGRNTELALREYQKRVRLKVTGRLDEETLAAMGLLPSEHRVPTFGRRGLRSRAE
jgi:peptidoglycan hydrolase-like protein with peptidoglycan-binding domain